MARKLTAALFINHMNRFRVQLYIQRPHDLENCFNSILGNRGISNPQFQNPLPTGFTTHALPAINRSVRAGLPDAPSPLLLTIYEYDG